MNSVVIQMNVSTNLDNAKEKVIEDLITKRITTNQLVLSLSSLELGTLYRNPFRRVCNVVILHLDNNSISAIPNGLLSLMKGVEELALHHNMLTTLPSDIGALVRLKDLRLDNNKLVSIPDEIGQCECLKRLNVNGNASLSSLPLTMGNLYLLQEILMTDVSIAKLPYSMYECTSLEVIEYDLSLLDPPFDVMNGGGSKIRHYWHRQYNSKFHVYSSRWLTLAIFCFLNLSNAMLWVTFAPISDISSDYFGGVGATAVNLLAIIYQVMYGPGTVLGVLVNKKYGTRNTMLVGGLLTVLGAFIRLVAVLLKEELGSTGSYCLVMLGQFFAALAQPFYVNLPSGIAAAWFQTDERDMATTIGALFNPLGNAMGQLLPSLCVSQRSDGKIAGMELLMGIEMCICATAFMMAFAFYRSKPPTAPSQSAAVKESNRHELKRRLTFTRESSVRSVSDSIRSVSDESKAFVEDREHRQSILSLWTDNLDYINKAKEEMHDLWHNRDFILLHVSFSVALGIVNGFLTLIFQIVEPFGYSNEDAGVFATTLLLCGLVGAGITGYLMDTTHYYRTILKSAFAANLCMMGVFVIMLYSNNFGWLCTAFGVLGFVQMPILPAVLENCAECTFPVSEELSVGLLFIGGNVVGIPIIFILQWLLEAKAWGPPPLLPSNLFLVLLLLFCTVVLFFYKGQYIRMACDNKKEQSLNFNSYNENGFAAESSGNPLLVNPVLVAALKP